MNTPPGARAVIYARQSRDAEGNGLAVARQLDECRKLAASRSWRVTAELTDNDISASNGKPRPEFERVMGMVRDRQADVVIVWAVDRLVRRLADLERVIEQCETAGVKLATVSGDLDLSTDQGRLVGRILASVARGEVERKSARQKLAAQQAAEAGRRRIGCPRPFGYQADHVTPDPAEADAIRWAADALLGGGTVSAVAREWGRRGLSGAQGGQFATDAGKVAPGARQAVTAILRNPALAGLSAYRGEIVADGDWTPVLPRETWEAVRALLNDPARKPPLGVRTLLGGLARCRCGNKVIGTTNAQGQPVYRCSPATRGDGQGPHVQLQVRFADEWVTLNVQARLDEDDVADLITPPARRADTAALNTEAASIRRNLDELAADRALGLVSRSQMLAATERGNTRLAEIAAELTEAAGGGPLRPFLGDEPANAVWARLDLARQRAVIDALCTVTLHPAGRGSRTFNPDTVVIEPRREA
jgi:DNA invertase Pin-like site-specific DNA recombinase